MKKLALAALAAVVLLAGFGGCRSMFGRGKGPIEAFVFLAANNPELSANVSGAVIERPDPKEVVLVVPPGTFVRSLIATISLNTEAAIRVISSGSAVVQKNGVTPNDFSSPVLYSIEVPGDKEPWLYRVTVREAETDAALAGLALPEGYELRPAFAPGVRAYSVEVPYAAQSLRIEARGRSRHLKSITIDGRSSPGASAAVAVDFSSLQERTIEVETLAEDGVSAERYSLVIRRGEPDRDSLLASLSIPGGALTPAFTPNRIAYVVAVPYSSRHVTVLGEAQSRVARLSLSLGEGGPSGLTIEGDPTTKEGARVAFATGSRLAMLLTVTAEDGSERPYNLEIRRSDPDSNANLASLTATEGLLVPAFSPKTVAYTLVLPAGSPQEGTQATPSAAPLQLSAAADSPLAAVGVLDDPALRPAPAQTLSLEVSPGQSRVVSFIVTAEDGTQKLYLVAVQRESVPVGRDGNALLMGLQVLGAQLAPEFSPNVRAYTATAAAAAESVTLAALPQSAKATVLVDGRPLEPSGRRLPLAAGRILTVQVEVRAEDGTTVRYGVQVTRGAPTAATPAPETTQPAEPQKPTAGVPAAGLPAGASRLLVQARNLRLGDREVALLSAASDRIGPQAEITLRYYRSDTVLSRTQVPVSSRQQGRNWALNLNAASQGFTVEYGRLVEIQVAVRTAAGGFLHYTEAKPAEEQITLEIPFMLYGQDPQVRWPAPGTRVPVAGYLSLLPPGQNRGQAGADREDFPKNERGEHGITVELSESTSGRVLAQDTVWNRPGLARGHRFAFAGSIELPEGAPIGYRLSARARNGRTWQTSGTTTVWTTMLEYSGGFKPALLFVADDLAPAGN